MKFSYSWIRALVDGLDVPAEALERLITMKTAECEGIETAGALLAGAVPATCRKRRADRGQSQREGDRGRGTLWAEDRGLRRAELPRGHHDRLCSAGHEDDFRRGERRHAGQRRGARDQPRPLGHHRTRGGAGTSASGQHHRDR